MKRNIGIGLIAGGALLMSALPAQAQDAHGGTPPGYLVFDTATLGGTVAVGNGINNLGWVSGLSTNATGAVRATLSIPGNVIDLGTLGGTNSAVEWPVKNNHGLVVGITETATPDPNGETFSCDPDFIPTNGHTCVPFIWQQSTGMTQLPLLGGNNGFATGVNDAGQAIGWAETAVHDKSCTLPQVLQFLAVQWGPATNQKQVLPPYPGDSTSAAVAINDSGQVVGISGDCGDAVGAFSARHALLWENAHPIRLPTLGGKGWNTPMAINNRGVAVGFSDTPGDVIDGVLTQNFQAVMWPSPATIVNLHTLPGDVLSEATGINDRGQIVGTSFDANFQSRVFLWQDGKMYDLNSLLAPNSPLYLVASGDIDDRGEITGQACVVASGCTVFHTFVAIPLPGSAPGWQDGGSERAPMYLPDDARAQIMRRLHLGRPAVSPRSE
jgi:probable HAF family extracellular repeat protein